MVKNLVLKLASSILMYYAKRDLKGFKCMTVRKDIFRDFFRLIKIFLSLSNLKKNFEKVLYM